MAKTAKMTFKKGDGLTKFFYKSAASWVAGAELRFVAKKTPDNDATDALAVINKTFDDDNILLPTSPFYKTGYVGYQCVFLPTDIVNVSFATGESKQTFKGEFQWTPSGGVPSSYPKDDNYIQVIVYADIAREAP